MADEKPGDGGADNLKRYWTKDPKGLAKWADKPHPFTALRNHLRRYLGDEERANRVAAEWFHEVFKMWPGERKGRNPLGPG